MAGHNQEGLSLSFGLIFKPIGRTKKIGKDAHVYVQMKKFHHHMLFMKKGLERALDVHQGIRSRIYIGSCAYFQNENMRFKWTPLDALQRTPIPTKPRVRNGMFRQGTGMLRRDLRNIARNRTFHRSTGLDNLKAAGKRPVAREAPELSSPVGPTRRSPVRPSLFTMSLHGDPLLFPAQRPFRYRSRFVFRFSSPSPSGIFQ